MPYSQAVFTTQRQSIRYAVDARVEILLDRQLLSIGRLLDISKHGAGFEAYTALKPGLIYTLAVRKITSNKFKILHKHNINRYGGIFIMSENSKYRLEKTIREIGTPLV